MLKFLSGFFLVLIALSAATAFADPVSAMAAQGGDLEPALQGFVDALKQQAHWSVIIMAFFQILKTRFVIALIGPLLLKLGIVALPTTTVPPAGSEGSPDPSAPQVTGDAAGVNPMLTAPIGAVGAKSGPMTPIATMLTGVITGAAQAGVQGKNVGAGALEGAIASGGAMLLYNLLAKPVSKLLTKK